MLLPSAIGSEECRDAMRFLGIASFLIEGNLLVKGDYGGAVENQEKKKKEQNAAGVRLPA